MKKLLLALFFAVLCAPNISAKKDLFPREEDPHKRDKWIQSTYINPETQQNLPKNIDELQRNYAKTLPIANEGLRTKGSQVQSQTWLNAGPNNIGGRTRAVAFDVNNPNILIAGGVSGGLWRSVDGGQSWVQTSGKKEVASVTAIAQDTRPGKTHIWYYGGGELRGNTAGESKNSQYYGDGIYKSTDNGLTWSALASTYSDDPQMSSFFSNTVRIVVDHTNTEKDIVYAACRGAIYKSEDGGDNWEGVLGNPSDPYRGSYYTDLIINDDGTLYAALSQYTRAYGGTANQYGFFRSKDGDNWENITPDNFQYQHLRTVLATGGGDDDLVYFLSVHGQAIEDAYCVQGVSGCHTLYTLYYGNKPIWDNNSSNLPQIAGKYMQGTYNSQYAYNMCIAVNPNNPDVVIIGGTNLYISDFGFYDAYSTVWAGGYNPQYDPYISGSGASWVEKMKNWESMMFPTGGWDFHTIVFHPTNPDIMITGSDHGIHRLNNFDDAIDAEEFTWDDLNNGYNTTQFYDCSIHPTKSGDETIIGGMQDNGTWGTFTSDVMFSNIAGGDGMHSAISSDGNIVVSSQNGHIMRVIFNDGQMTDGYYIYPEEDFDAEYGFYAPFEINPNDTKGLAMGAQSSITYCSDYLNKNYASMNWHNVVYETIYDHISSTCIAFAESKENLVFVGTNYNAIYKINDISTPASTVAKIEFPDYIYYSYVADLWVNPQDENHLIAILSNYNIHSILETTDGGQTWTSQGGNLEENEDGTGNGPSVRAYARLDVDGQTVHFVGTSAGLYSTTNLDGANTTWIREGENTIGMAVVSQIHARQSDKRIVVSTHGNGIFKTTYSTSVEDFNGQNLGFVVSEVYPNPTTDQINFVLNSDKPSFVEAKIVDISGNIVAKIISEDFVGTKHIEYNAAKLAQGTYFLNISDGTHYVTKKINIIR